VRLLDLQAGVDVPVETLLQQPVEPQGKVRAYRDGTWYVQELLPIRQLPAEPQRYRQHGVYVVIGGAGGIGEVWSRFMIETYGAHIVWIGRRPLDAAIQARLEALGALGPAPLYISADATDRAALERAYREIKQHHEHVHGLVHSAIVLADQSLANMDEARFGASLAAKMDVSVRMAQVFQNEALDFVLFFSSLQSFSTSPGQSNYAAGCTFKDALAHYLAHAWPATVRVMNWGYWGGTGIVAAPDYQARMARAGVGSIEPAAGMAALTLLLNGPLRQIAAIQTLDNRHAGDAGEWLMAYAEQLPSCLSALPKHLPDRAAQVERCAAEAGRQDSAMQTLLLKLLWGSLQAAGLFREPGPSMPVLPNFHARWLEATVTLLAAAGYVQRHGAACTVLTTEAVDLAALWRQWEQHKVAWNRDSITRAQVGLVEACLRALPDILTGKRPATDMIFPNSSMAHPEPDCRLL
jgi:NAD(P)-dependent dehydrogenase (short-subunit alcohol dehydrogenase family)